MCWLILYPLKLNEHMQIGKKQDQEMSTLGKIKINNYPNLEKVPSILILYKPFSPDL